MHPHIKLHAYAKFGQDRSISFYNWDVFVITQHFLLSGSYQLLSNNSFVWNSSHIIFQQNLLSLYFGVLVIVSVLWFSLKWTDYVIYSGSKKIEDALLFYPLPWKRIAQNIILIHCINRLLAGNDINWLLTSFIFNSVCFCKF